LNTVDFDFGLLDAARYFVPAIRFMQVYASKRKMAVVIVSAIPDQPDRKM
jgi:hypothetical protein